MKLWRVFCLTDERCGRIERQANFEVSWRGKRELGMGRRKRNSIGRLSIHPIQSKWSSIIDSFKVSCFFNYFSRFTRAERAAENRGAGEQSPRQCRWAPNFGHIINGREIRNKWENFSFEFLLPFFLLLFIGGSFHANKNDDTGRETSARVNFVIFPQH